MMLYLILACSLLLLVVSLCTMWPFWRAAKSLTMRVWVIGLLGLFIASVALLYWQQGASKTWGQWRNTAEHTSLEVTEVERILRTPLVSEQDKQKVRNIEIALRSRLLIDKTSASVWYMLGLTYLRFEQTERAVDAFKEAYARDPQDVKISISYAQALIIANAGKSSELSQQILQNVLSRHPEHEGALMLLGYSLFNSGIYAPAVAAWQKIIARHDPKSEAVHLLNKSIEEAKRRVSAEATGPNITVRVSLAPALMNQVQPDDRVFVYAKAQQGPPQPLAAVTLKVADLPKEVRLSDANAMLPTMRLSQYKNVMIGARISKTGQAIASSGDLFHEQAHQITTPSSILSLQIDRQVP